MKGLYAYAYVCVSVSIASYAYLVMLLGRDITFKRPSVISSAVRA